MINLLYSGNTKVYDGFMLSLLSAARNTKESLNVYILTASFVDMDPRFTPVTVEQAALLEKMIRPFNDESRVNLLDVRELFDQYMGHHCINLKNGYTPYALLRLLMDIIPGLPDRILYLDADTIVTGDLKELYEYDLKDKTVGAVRDYLGRFFIGINYVNSGVMLINMKQAREEHLFFRAREQVNKILMGFPDQTALNHCLTGEKRYLPRRFNAMRHLTKKTVVRHYCKMIIWFPFHIINVKPWQIDDIHRRWHVYAHDDLYFDFLKFKRDNAMEK